VSWPSACPAELTNQPASLKTLVRSAPGHSCRGLCTTTGVGSTHLAMKSPSISVVDLYAAGRRPERTAVDQDDRMTGGGSNPRRLSRRRCRWRRVPGEPVPIDIETSDIKWKTQGLIARRLPTAPSPNATRFRTAVTGRHARLLCWSLHKGSWTGDRWWGPATADKRRVAIRSAARGTARGWRSSRATGASGPPRSRSRRTASP
jgi:hypothetical protein